MPVPDRLVGSAARARPPVFPEPSPGVTAAATAPVDPDVPPRELWPDLVYKGAGLSYPAAISIADVLLNQTPVATDRRTAVIFRGERISIATLRRRTRAVASRLASFGVHAGDRVALMMANEPDLLAVWLAIQWLGAIGVPLPPTYRRREIAYVLEHSGAALIVCSPDVGVFIEPVAVRYGVHVVTSRAVCSGGVEIASSPHPRRDDEPVLLTYIASDSGRLKGVIHSAVDLLAAADTYAADILALDSNDVCIAPMSVASAFGLGALLTFPLRFGAAAVLVDSAASVPVAVAEARATVMFAPPTLYRMLLSRSDFDSFDLRSLRCCVSAAEPLPAPVMERWRARTGLDILDGLGTTELAHIIISSRMGAVRPGSIGRPVRGYDVRIVDDELREVAANAPGHLAVRGPTGARYWRDIEAQQSAVRLGWTLTGDICACDAEGLITHIRRSDDLIVSAGYKISAREVEIALEDRPEVAEAHVYAVPDSVRGFVTHATVRTRGVNPDGVAERLLFYLRSELAPYKCPREIRIV